METILMFVGIAIISSLFSKDKSAPRKRPHTNQQMNPTKEKGRGLPSESRPPKQREIFTYDSIEEIEANYYHIKEETKTKEPVNRLSDYKKSKKELKVIDVETMEFEEEAKFDGELLNFTPNSIVQAIVMAEILDKPKGMRK